ncbi:MAG: hypothetical protein WBL96_06095, partial [Pseudolabrys sp.]
DAVVSEALQASAIDNSSESVTAITPKFMIELLLRSDLAVEFTEFKIVLPRAAVFLAGSAGRS